MLSYIEKENLSEMIATTSALRVSKVSTTIYKKIEELYKKFLNKELSQFEFNGLVVALIDKNIENIDDETNKELKSNARKEIDESDSLLKKTAFFVGIPLLTLAVKREIENNALNNNPYYVNEFQFLKPKMKQRIIQNIYDIIANSKTEQEAKQQLDNIKNINSREIQSLFRTMSRDIQTQSMLGTYRENNVKYVQFIAKVDSRTTAVCLKFNRLYFPIDDCPEPALHPNCRSILVPVDESQVKNIQSFKFIYTNNKQTDRDLGRLKYV